MEQGGDKGSHVSPHGQSTNEGVALQDREGGGPPLQMRKNTNAAHLLELGCVGGETRKWEDIWKDREFCAEVTKFLRGNEAGETVGAEVREAV